MQSTKSELQKRPLEASVGTVSDGRSGRVLDLLSGMIRHLFRVGGPASSPPTATTGAVVAVKAAAAATTAPSDLLSVRPVRAAARRTTAPTSPVQDDVAVAEGEADESRLDEVSDDRSIDDEPLDDAISARPSRSSLDYYTAQVRTLPTTSRREEVQLVLAARKGDAQARTRLVEAHLNLVVNMARTYAQHNLPLEDLIEEGNLGLLEAVNRFDPDHGVRFATYARWWIREAIGTAITNHSRTIRLPSHVVRGVGKVIKARRRLDDGSAPPAAGGRLARIAAATGESVTRVAELEALAQAPISVDAPVDGDPDLSLGDTLGGGAEPDGALLTKQTIATVLRLVNQLPRNERIVITLRFGLDGRDQRTLEEIGLLIDLSAERVRQLHVQGVQRLREICAAQNIALAALL